MSDRIDEIKLEQYLEEAGLLHSPMFKSKGDNEINTLERWEAEAKDRSVVHFLESELRDRIDEDAGKILALCALVRAKDEAILAMLTRNSIFETEGKLARDALALTEQLGSWNEYTR